MSKICYLHLGLPKTASTSFQQTCKKNKELLRINGLTYPIFSTAGRELLLSNHGQPIAILLAKNPIKDHRIIDWGVSNNIKEVLSSFESQFDDCLKSSENLILSGEMISTYSENKLSKLVKKIQSYDYTLKVFAFVRSPYSQFCSELQQRMRLKHVNLISLNNCVPASFDTSSFSKLGIIKKLKSFFCDAIRFSSFEDACSYSYGPVGFLLKEFLNQDPLAFEYKISNTSRSNLSIRLQNELNKINPKIIDSKVNPEFMKLPEMVEKSLESSGKFLLTEVEYSLIESFIKNEAESLNKVLGINFSDEVVLFSDPIF